MYQGWLQDRIGDLVEDKWPVFAELPYCLVASIDSSRDVASMMTAEEVAGLEPSCSFLGNGFVIGGARFLSFAEKYRSVRGFDLFNGFDEIWLFADRPTLEKPPAIWIVAPRDLNKDPLPDGLLEWFNASGCVLGLGDGIGMNYVTRRKEIVESLTVRQKELDSGQ